MICSKGNLSMVAGAHVGFEAPSVELSIAADVRAGVENLSRNDWSRGVALVTSSEPDAMALLGEPCCDGCWDWGKCSIDSESGSWINGG